MSPRMRILSRLNRLVVPLATTLALVCVLWITLNSAGAQATSDLCFVEFTGDNATDFSSPDSLALRLAIEAAATGDTVKIAGTCAGTVDEGGTRQVVRIDKVLTLAGGYTTTNWITPSAGQTTTLDALQTGRVLLATAALTLRDLTIQNGLTTGVPGVGDGAGINTSQSITLNQVILFNNATSAPGTAGGGAYILGAASITGTQFRSNQSRRGGGGAVISGGADITGSQFIGNETGGDGGGMIVQGLANITGSSFINNLSNSLGGGASLGEFARITDTVFISNTASSFGGGIVVANARIVGTSFDGNAAQFGGGAMIFVTANITASAFLSNTASAYGGGAVIGGSASQPSQVINTLFASNRALTEQGSALYLAGSGGNAGQFALLHNTIASPAAQDGAAIFVNSGTVGITNTIVSNQATAIERSNGTVSEDYNLFDNVTTPYSGTIADGGNSITGTAAFADAANGDYQISDASDAINAGTDAGISDDFFGDTRPQQGGFDIGFDEFFVAPTVPLCFTEYSGDNVTDFSSADSQAVRAAVAAANPGGTVKIAGMCAGVVNERDGDQVVIVDKALTLAGGYTVTNWINPSAVQTTTLDALHSGRVISSTAALTVRDLTIQNGRTLISSPAGNGAGIYTNQGITLSQLVFYNNVIPGATTQGGGAYVGGRANVTGTQFISNTAFVGGGLNAAAGANITNTSFLSNTAIVAGGGAFVNGVSSLSGNRFVNNTAPGFGGGFAGETVSIADTSFISNTASGGGGVYIDGMANLTSTSLVSNTARSEGGGAYFKQGASIENSSFISNTAAGDGGGAVVLNSASITGTSFFSNTAGSDAGGLAVRDTANITSSSFFSNTAKTSGGGALVIGTANITGASFLSNRAASGGGVVVIGAASITGTSFLSNTTDSEGGGALIVVNTDELSQVVNTLFVNNRATNSQGNALYMFGRSANVQLALLHMTVASSVAPTGPAIFVNNGTVGITNTIVSNYAIAIERVDGAVNEDFNLFDNVTTPFSGTVTAGTHSITGTAAFVDAANGDYQLTALSDAINAGTNAGIAIDFFNMPRPYGDGFDMGYAEFSRDEIYLPHIQRD